MNRFSLAIKFFKNNFKQIIIFEAIYKIILMAIVTPLLVELVDIAMRLSGINYLTNARLMGFLAKPTTIAILILVVVLYAIISIMEMGAITHAYNIYYNGGNVSIVDMIKSGIFSALRLLSPYNIPMIFFVIALLPVIYLGSFSSYLSSMQIPAFIVEYLKQKKGVMLWVTLGIAVAIFFTIKWINAMNYYVTEKMNFISGVKASKKLNRKRYFGLVLGFIAWQILIYLVLFISYAAITFVISVVLKLMLKRKFAYNVSLFIAKWIYDIWGAIYICMIVPLSCAYFSGYFFERKKADREDIVIPKITTNKTNSDSRYRRILSVIVVISAVMNLIYLNFDFGLFRGSAKIQLFSQTSIAAHRGYSAEAPENTIPAFEAAIDNYADYVELDVQETKDGVVVVMHDSNTKRTTGVKKNIWNLTYDELSELDAGSWFSEEYADTKVPMLSEVLEMAKDRLKLNVEIKLTGHEKNLEESVAALIEEYDMVDQCVVTSFQPKALKRIKSFNPEIKTGYILHVAYGDFSNVSYADALSVNYSFATENFIDSAHDADMEVYVWTVNTAEAINDMLENGADMIITDDPVLARETVTSYETTPYIVKLIKFYFEKIG